MGQFSVEKPVLPGSVLSGNQQAGIIDEVGSDVFDRLKVGDAVMAIVGAEDGPAAQTLHRTEYGAKSQPRGILGEIRNAISAPSLREGDQIVVRYLEEPDDSSRPLAFTLTATHDDRINGYLSLTSPLAKALADAVVCDEIAVDEGQGLRPLLFVLHQLSESLADVT